MTRITEIKVSPQEEMANPQSMEMFVVENMGFLEISCLFVLCVECNRHNLSVRRINRLPGVRYSGRHRERLGASGLGSPELSFQVRRSNACTTCIQLTWTLLLHARAETVKCASRMDKRT